MGIVFVHKDFMMIKTEWILSVKNVILPVNLVMALLLMIVLPVRLTKNWIILIIVFVNRDLVQTNLENVHVSLLF